MFVETVTMSHGQLQNSLLDRLAGRVLHATTRTAFEKILRDGAILSNEQERFAFSYSQSRESSLRKAGYVSMFDLRDPGAYGHLAESFLFDTLLVDHGPSYLFLSEHAYQKLVSAEVVARGEGPGAMYMPQVEVGVRGRVALDDIDAALLVEIDPPRQEGDLSRAFRMASQRKVEGEP